MLSRTAIGLEGLIPMVINRPVRTITQAAIEAHAAMVTEKAPKVCPQQVADPPD